MTVFESMYPSSYKGARFWFRASDTSSGRKTVVHEFPQKDIRYVEDLGKNLKTLEIRGIIRGDLYFTDKQRLEQALTSDGIGILVHPFYGNLNVYALSYDVTEEDSSIGVAHFTMRFAETSENFSPRLTDNNTSFINEIYQDNYGVTQAELSLEYSLDFITNIEDSVEVADRALQIMVNLAKTVTSIAEGRDTFTKSVDNFDVAKYGLAQVPDGYSASLVSIFNDYDNLTTDQQDRFDISKRAFGLGSDDEFATALTPEIEERQKNRKSLNGVFNYLLLNNLFAAASLIDYEDDLQLDNIQKTLDDFYSELLSNRNYLLTNDLVNNITRLRNEVRKFFDAQRLTVAKVTTIKIQTIPAAVLSYQYYGSSDNYDEILSLNDITNPAVISGDIRILEK